MGWEKLGCVRSEFSFISRLLWTRKVRKTSKINMMPTLRGAVRCGAPFLHRQTDRWVGVWLELQHYALYEHSNGIFDGLWEGIIWIAIASFCG